MADKKFTDLPTLTAPASGDYLPVIDVSDTTDAPTGTPKKLPLGSLPTADLSNYVTTTALDTALSDYATTSAMNAALAGKQAAITTGSTAQYLRGDLSLSAFASDVASAMLTGRTINQVKTPVNPITFASSFTVPFATANNHEVTLAGNATITLSGGADGAKMSLKVHQNGTGGYVITWGGSGANAIEFPDGTPDPVTTANQTITYLFDWSPTKGKWLGYVGGPQNISGDFVTDSDLTTALAPYATTSALTSGLAGKEATITGDGNAAHYWNGSKAFAAISASHIPSTGVANDSCTTAIGTATTSGSTQTLDLGAKANWVVTLGSNCTLNFSNIAARKVAIDIKQDASTAYTYALDGSVTYDYRTASGSAPATPAAGKALTLVLWFTDATHATVYVAWSPPA